MFMYDRRCELFKVRNFNIKNIVISCLYSVNGDL